MKLAIHKSDYGFHPRWVEYCKMNQIAYKLVDCYSNDVIDQLKDCDALMWHHSQGSGRDILAAKKILFALYHIGFNVFPNFYTNWHFDDKIAQKYLLELVGNDVVPSYVFYTKKDAKQWLNTADFPIVWKLKGGAGSANVQLVENKNRAHYLVNKAFLSGFSSYNTLQGLKERWTKYTDGRGSVVDLLKGVYRLLLTKPRFSVVEGKDVDYIYFQKFLPNNNSDTRIIVIGNKAFGLKRYVRKNDFRASGSGNFKYDREEFDERCVAMAFLYTKKLKSQCVAFDFVFNEKDEPMIVEISYGFVAAVYDPCPGYWDDELNWHEKVFNPYGWMVDDLMNTI